MPWPIDSSSFAAPVVLPADGLPVTRVHVATEPPRYATAADLAGLALPVLTAERGELLARASGEVGAAVRERGRWRAVGFVRRRLAGPRT